MSVTAVSPPRAFAPQQLDASVLRLFHLVRDALASATEIFLSPTREAARSVAPREQEIDALHGRLEDEVLDRLVEARSVEDGHRRELLTIMRILPELERSGDLAEHIASHGAQDLATWLTPRARSLVAQMGAIGVEMWEMAAVAYTQRNPEAAVTLRARDDEVDDLHVSLTAELAAGKISIPVAIEMGLVARYFERLGDHAVNVTRRLADLQVPN